MPPEPRANPLLLGHETAEATLLDAMRSGRMHHAWLITGPDGVGKATLAYRFARRLLAGTPTDNTLALSPTDPTFRRVAAGAHADLSHGRARLRREAQADAHPDRGGRRPRHQQLHEPHPGRGRLARRHRRRRGGAQPVLGQRTPEDPGGTPVARDPPPGMRRPRPPAGHHPQPLPSPPPGPPQPRNHGHAAGHATCRTCPPTTAAAW